MENDLSWELLGEEKQQEIFKYLKLLKIFTLNHDNVSFENKKWLLENCDLPTHLVPGELMGRFWL